MNLPICEFHQGDWLIPFGDTPDQIYSISFQEEMAGIWPIIQFRHNRNEWIYPSFCTRIELTEEFFEHNGFEYSPFSSGSYDYKDEEFKKFLCYYFKFGEKLFEMYKNGDYKIEEIQ